MLKIDMEFLEDFAGSERARSIIENVVHMSRDISAVSLIEGVENEEQAAFLRNIGCEKAQGFYFARPTEKEQLKV
jgi:EAL domain-containing protein (putative c-di-GMP-specific phosphodiesterase class I)